MRRSQRWQRYRIREQRHTALYFFVEQQCNRQSDHTAFCRRIRCDCHRHKRLLDSAQMSVTLSGNLILSVDGEVISCLGASDGILSAMAVSGQSPVTYLWSPDRRYRIPFEVISVRACTPSPRRIFTAARLRSLIH